MSIKNFVSAATYIYILSSLFLLSGCGQHYDLDKIPTHPALTSNEENPEDPGPNPVCNPFGDPSDLNPNGPQIWGNLYGGMPLKYATNSSGQSVRLPIQTVNMFFAKDEAGKEIYRYNNSTLFFENINAPERAFDRGFSTIHGDTLVSPTNQQPLVEFFAMSLGSNIKLDLEGPDRDSEGQYQFALLSDDGSNIYFNGSSTPSISNDGEHPPMLACATSATNMTASTRIPFELDYYQGPKYHIAMVLMWRKIAPGQSLEDPKCRPANFSSLPSSEKSQYYVWEEGTGGATRTGEYAQLLMRGWKPLKSTNFIRGANSPIPPAGCSK